MYEYVYIYFFHIFTHLPAQLLVFIGCIHTNTHTHTHTCAYIRIHVPTYLHTFTHTCMYSIQQTIFCIYNKLYIV